MAGQIVDAGSHGLLGSVTATHMGSSAPAVPGLAERFPGRSEVGEASCGYLPLQNSACAEGPRELRHAGSAKAYHFLARVLLQRGGYITTAVACPLLHSGSESSC